MLSSSWAQCVISDGGAGGLQHERSVHGGLDPGYTRIGVEAVVCEECRVLPMLQLDFPVAAVGEWIDLLCGNRV